MASGPEFFSQKLDLKRKRVFNDFDLESEQSSKRSNLSQLPFRTSPTMLHSQPTWPNFASPFQQPLTPVDSSDDEAHGQADNSWIRKRATASPPKRLTNYKIPSVTVDLDAMEDDLAPAPAVVPAAPRAVLAGSYRQINFLSAPAVSLEERVPTPISSSFSSLNKAPKSHSRNTTRHTILSPLMAEEPYLPSPLGSSGMPLSPDPETAMHMEHASSGFGALSVDSKGDDNDHMMMMDETVHTIVRDSPPHAIRHARANSARNARLHMGFRSDCEKCQQRVPGHYSHIIWS